LKLVKTKYILDQGMLKIDCVKLTLSVSEDKNRAGIVDNSRKKSK
jgi:hypothetical protein